ncbi:MAG: AraC family transcriptional regulator [Cytophagaceae bacterium]|jgi:AraC-like DNA-binding protein|nr:AraC family transcriptional regulator [Cytophagaceae bacterium]
MKRAFPVYDICKFSLTQEEDIIIKRFAPYLKTLTKVHFPHRHDFYHLVFFTHGGGGHSIDFEQFKIQPFHVYFMVPGQVHDWSFEGEMDGYVINFSTVFFQSFLLNTHYLDQFSFFRGNVSTCTLNIPEAQQQRAIEILEKAVQEEEQAGKFRQDILRVLLLEFFLLMSKVNGDMETSAVQENHSYTLVRNFERLIEEHYLHQRLPKYYAEQLCISPSHLNAICQDILGTSAGELIRNRIVLEAKRMLVNLDLTVGEIAYGLNFTDNSYFGKFFKNQTGMTPEVFRKKF